MRLLVTGSAGNLGRAFRRRLDALGSGGLDIRASYAVSPRSEPGEGVVLDLDDDESIRRVVEQAAPNAVVHLAALVGGECASDPARARRINVDATETLALAAAEVGATRFALASTAAVYGDRFSSPVHELAPVDASSDYARTKLAAEERLAAVHRRYPGLAPVSLRIFNIYGDGFSGSLVNRLRSATAQAPVTLTAPDSFVRDYVHADDVADALLAAVDADRAPASAVYNIGSGEALSSRQLVERLRRTQELHYTEEAGRASYSVADIAKARHELGFSPRMLG